MLERIDSLVREILPAAPPVSPSTRIADLGLDSLDLFEIAVALSREWGAAFEPQDAGRFRTVGDLIVTLDAEGAQS
jgi:acyl carrier protein